LLQAGHLRYSLSIGEFNSSIITSNRYDVDEKIAKAIADAVWNTSRNIRDSVKIARVAKAVEDVDWLVTTFLR
jgi:hypothetical protein